MHDYTEVSLPDRLEVDVVQLQLRYRLRSHPSAITRLAWSPNGTTLAAATFNHLISLWDTQTGELRAQLRGHSHTVTGLAWSPDSRMLASGARDGRVCLWHLSERDQPCHLIPGSRLNIWDIAWYPDFPWLAVSLADNTVLVWDVAAVKLHQIYKEHTSIVRQIACAPDGLVLASIADDKTLRLWDSATERCTQIYQFPAIPYCLTWLRYGSILAVGLFDQTIQIWDVAQKQHLATLQAHTGSVVALDFSADGQWLASKSFDGTIRLWHWRTQQVVAVLDELTGGSWPTALAFHPQLPLLATLDDNDIGIRIWDLAVTTRPVVSLVLEA